MSDFNGPVHEQAGPGDVCNRCGETWPCDVTELREAYSKRIDPSLLPAIVFALRYDDFGDDDWITWERCVRRWEEIWKPALQEEHFGDCIQQPQACFRCQAEDVVRVAGILKAAI